MAKKNIRVSLLLLADAVCSVLSYLLAFFIRFDFEPDKAAAEPFFNNFLSCWFVLCAIKLVVYWLFGMYRSLWEFAGIRELFLVACSCVVGNALTVVYLVLVVKGLPRSIYCIVGLLDLFFVGGLRVLYRYVRSRKNQNKKNAESGKSPKKLRSGWEKRIILVGCGNAGAMIIKELKSQTDVNQRIVAGVDDDYQKRGSYISGVKIRGSRSDIPALAEKYNADEIIIAMPSASKKTISEIIDICHNTRCKVRVMPMIYDLVNGKASVKDLRDVEIEDLLGRDPIKVNLEEISGYISGRTVLVTGAGGSIGSELCRQIAGFKPARLVLFDIYENTTFYLQNELKDKFPDLELEANIGSVRDRRRLQQLFEEYHPQVIFHAAAHKHVPLMEDNPKEALLNNVLGTKNVIDMAAEYTAEHFILISTDKAVNPTNVMGASKRMCEMLMQNKAAECSTTTFAAVRFGNVLGSNGSVIPTFRQQIAKGGPVTVTHPEITRYFMTIPEAVQLVIQAGALAKGGEIFILDMGQPVKILDLAEKMIKLSGLTPYEDIDIKITGLRPGEKLYEELLLAEEGIRETVHNKIFVGHPISITPAFKALLDQEDALEAEVSAVRMQSDEAVKNWVASMVPNYVQTPNK